MMNVHSYQLAKVANRICLTGVILCGMLLVSISCRSCTSTAFVVGALNAQALRYRVLCEVNHGVLLRAGRDLLTQARQKDEGLRRYRVRGGEGAPEIAQMPQVIRDLAPRYVTVDAASGSVSIEMHGAMDHFGVHIYAEDFREPHPGFTYGNRMLLKGLWYYDEEYNYDPTYDKVIAEMLCKPGCVNRQGQGEN